MKNTANTWAFYMDAALHTAGLTKQQADAMFKEYAARDPHSEVEIYIADVPRYARICSATSEGMNEGYLFEDALLYFAEREAAEKFARNCGYADLDEAYDDEAYCYTEWDVEDEDEWYEKHAGVWYECTDDSRIAI